MKARCDSLPAAAAAALLFSATPAGAGALPRDALWRVVRLCELDAKWLGSPFPCLRIDRSRGVAVLADPKRRTQLLLTPLSRTVGIESASLYAPDAPNLWAAAWDARSLFARRAGALQPGFAVNSLFGRTQDQLHIHIDCVREDVHAALAAQAGTLDEAWVWLAAPLRHGHRYRARWLPEDALMRNDPFRLLEADAAAGIAYARTLAMIPLRRGDGRTGFALLARQADPDRGDVGAAEELLDHRCGSR